jgi:beta-fructofuranosidase
MTGRQPIIHVALLTAVLTAVMAQNPEHCLLSNGTLAPCGPGNEQCGPEFLNAPQYHIRGKSCGLNDPNAPFYDKTHGIYHLFYQNHVAEPMGPNGVTWAHVVSRDLVHWARLPVALWNDKPYDRVAIYTGSATMVNGVITLMYPGLCTSGEWPPCKTGYNLVTAVPASSSTDPLLQNWTKLGAVYNNSDKDPSTAWKTPAGEWRVVTGGNDEDHDPMVMGSMDFHTWYEIGVQPGWDGGDCPSFFPLPRPTPGSESPAYNSRGHSEVKQPTHVHMVGGGWMSLGQYTAGAPKTNGTWLPADPKTHRKADWGNYYATKVRREFFNRTNGLICCSVGFLRPCERQASSLGLGSECRPKVCGLTGRSAIICICSDPPSRGDMACDAAAACIFPDSR